jgi:hypothetical protein
MSDGASRGPAVPDPETLHRCITTSDWWVANERRPSSAAFRHPKFSADIASMANAQQTLDRMVAGGCDARSGIVGFSAKEARALSYNPHQEPDLQFPENEAHANVYCDLPKSQMKKRAQELRTICTVVIPPTFQT